MKNGTYRNIDIQFDTGFHISFVTMKQNSPLHWHLPLEILFLLNGSGTLHVEQEQYQLAPLEVLVIDSSKVHDAIYELPHTMGICIHISKNYMRKFIPDMELLRIDCSAKNLRDDQKDAYSELCNYLKDLTVLYVNQPKSYELRSNALILEILACLVDHFSIPMTDTLSVADLKNIDRMNQIADYVEEHYRLPVKLQDVADELMLNKEYFCRFFKQNTGVSFLTYVNQVRINHIYLDLIRTEDSTGIILERHGFGNVKLFYKMFKDIYGCTPRELRNMTKGNPFV